MKYILLLCLLFLTSYVDAQDELNDSTNDPIVCSFKCSSSYAFLTNSCITAKPPVRATAISNQNINPYDEFDIVISRLSQDLVNPIKLSYIFTECTKVCNAAACLKDSCSYIFYNQDFLNKIKLTNDSLKWAVRAIIAHEIGHHFLGHTSLKGNDISSFERRKQELKADYFCGFVIKQFPGATLNDALQGLYSLDPKSYTPKNETDELNSNYPTLKRRMDAVIEGFLNTNDSTHLYMLKSIDSIGRANYKKNGRSLIYRTIDKSISKEEYQKAFDLIEEYLIQYPELNNDKILLNQKSLLKDLINRNVVPNSINDIDSNTEIAALMEKIKGLRKLYDQYKTGNRKEIIEADKIRQEIEKLEIKVGQIKTENFHF